MQLTPNNSEMEEPENWSPIVHDSNSKLRGAEFFASIGSPKYVCSPMVEQSELSFRMLTRRYGADLAYTPMFHSRLFSEDKAYRKRNFQSCPEDRPLFVQFCGDNPDILVSAAKHVEAKCDAVDLNCGCPQGIARKGHYGAYLLSEVDLLENIVSRMDSELAVPVTVKLRIISNHGEKDLQETLNLCSRLEAAGCSVLTVHGRTKEQKSQFTGAPDWQAIRAVKQRLSIPVIANGGVENYEDANECLRVTGADAVMSSEGLLEVPCLFSGRSVPQDQLTKEYLDLAMQYATDPKIVKAHLFRFLYAGLQRHTDLRDQLSHVRNMQEMVTVADILRHRRVEEQQAGNVWPDVGWYRRHRNPLGNDKGRNEIVQSFDDAMES